MFFEAISSAPLGLQCRANNIILLAVPARIAGNK
jgi:hypothetical protein